MIWTLCGALTSIHAVRMEEDALAKRMPRKSEKRTNSFVLKESNRGRTVMDWCDQLEQTRMK